MGRQESKAGLDDDIDDFLESGLDDDFSEVYETLPSSKKKLHRLVELRRKAEEKIEQKRIEAEYSFDDLDWND